LAGLYSRQQLDLCIKVEVNVQSNELGLQNKDAPKMRVAFFGMPGGGFEPYAKWPGIVSRRSPMY